MDNQVSGHEATGLIWTALSIVSGLVGWISLHTFKENLQIASLIVSIAAGIMAIRHYYLQNKKK